MICTCRFQVSTSKDSQCFDTWLYANEDIKVLGGTDVTEIQMNELVIERTSCTKASLDPCLFDFDYFERLILWKS